MLKPIIGWYGTPKFQGENFHRWLQTAKFVNVFSLESFALYDSDAWAVETELCIESQCRYKIISGIRTNLTL